jgi:hypothetical protein
VPETAAAGPGQASSGQVSPKPTGVDLTLGGSRAEVGLAVFTIVTGVIAFAVGWVVRLHLIAVVFAIASMVVGMYAQLESSTRNQRIVIVSGMVAAFVGGALALAHGGFG